MLLRVDPGSSVGLAEQIAGQVRGQVADGALRPGDRLPPARQLAAGLDVNMHTVLRAYAMLRDEGLVELRRGRGAHVTAAASEQRTALRNQVREVVSSATRLGLSRDELLDEIRKAFP
ncbi:GntR family transcriptional regulator [Nocardioides sp. CER19]|uniref:GntR family transcriptional regulator n=1 Tax=Nocardioides sp. CER19 TaxID=3038538 RepID=UPI00244724D5|nr:GntR family transcriptional regulator [Nocardioides sp. CER19]MDH2414932.1 GntR family transcriptional regulator [Nocardioides sp. CER19]